VVAGGGKSKIERKREGERKDVLKTLTSPLRV
jgi:hypothetical protein